MPGPADPQAWIEQAQEHARAAQDLQEAGRWPLGVCIHAQQAIEMSLKAFLVANGLKHSFTHDLNLLFRDVPASSAPSLDLEQSALRAELTRLTQFWFSRYPSQNPPRSPTWDEAEAALSLANQFVEWAACECGLEPSEPPAPDD